MFDNQIAEVYINNEKDVFKYIHVNGVENCIKFAQSCTNEGTLKDNNKAVLFLSSSLGCKQRCKFCYLTAKKFGHKKLKEDDIIFMAKMILLNHKEELKNKYLKLSFMGMGDFLADGLDIIKIVTEIFTYVIEKNLIKGIDGVDVGTSFPKNVNVNRFMENIMELNDLLWDNLISTNILEPNPANLYVQHHNLNNEVRTIVRLFMSLHGTNDIIRQALMPNTENLQEIKNHIHNLNIDVIFHTMFFHRINDGVGQIKDLVNFMVDKYPYDELRLLRFNKCGWSNPHLKESKHIETIIDYYKASNLNFKYQVSAGSEIKASCGQFICKVK